MYIRHNNSILLFGVSSGLAINESMIKLWNDGLVWFGFFVWEQCLNVVQALNLQCGHG